MNCLDSTYCSIVIKFKRDNADLRDKIAELQQYINRLEERVNCFEARI
jgi:predicted RNase H-like nuclease (RuvC/YqgF family)